MSFSMINFVSLYLLPKHKQFCFNIPYSIFLVLFFFFKQFQPHCFYKALSYTKYSTNLNHEEGKQATID